jgi:cellulose synthase/poly-beta-1,6-N-acetylglucosamine synthase-like glycosyltransferase
LVTATTIKELVSSIGTHDACVGFVIARGNTISSILGELETLFLNATNFWVSEVLGTAFVIGRNYIIRRDVLNDVGNFDNVLSEDINLSYKLYSSAKRVVFNPDAICYERSPKKISHFFKQQERWGAGSFHEIGKSMRTHALLSLTLFFIATFYVLTPAFLLLSTVTPLFAIAGIAGLVPLAYLSFKHLNKRRLPFVPLALLVMMFVFLVVALDLIVKKCLGIKIGWYKTPR